MHQSFFRLRLLDYRVARVHDWTFRLPFLERMIKSVVVKQMICVLDNFNLGGTFEHRIGQDFIPILLKFGLRKFIFFLLFGLTSLSLYHISFNILVLLIFSEIIDVNILKFFRVHVLKTHLFWNGDDVIFLVIFKLFVSSTHSSEEVSYR